MGTRQGEEASGSAGGSETARQFQVHENLQQPTERTGDLEQAKKRERRQMEMVSKGIGNGTTIHGGFGSKPAEE